MYNVLILLHSWMRWIVILAALVAVFRVVSGRSSGRAWAPADESATRWYTILFDVQVLFGLLLYLTASPIVTMARQHMAEAMGASSTRFWLVEHPFGMIVALALAHVGRSRVRKAQTDRLKFTRALVFFGLSALIAILSNPWPGLPYARALFRMP